MTNQSIIIIYLRNFLKNAGIWKVSFQDSNLAAVHHLLNILVITRQRVSIWFYLILENYNFFLADFTQWSTLFNTEDTPLDTLLKIHFTNEKTP